MLNNFLWAWADCGSARLRVYAPQHTPLPLPQGERVDICRVPLAGHSRAARIAFEHLRLPRLLRRDAVEVLHAPAYIVPLAATCPVILTLHDLHVFTHPQCCRFENRLYYRLFLTRSLRKAAHIVVFSDHVRRTVLARYGWASDSISVIPPGFERQFAPHVANAAVQRVRQKYGLPPQYLLFVGDIAPRKNLTRLLQAFRTICADNPDIQLVLVGHAGKARGGALQQTITALGLRQRVIVTGYVARAELPALYTGARALAFPSLDEGFGLPLLEAMACGCPVVSGPGGMAEMGEGAVAACDPLDAVSIAMALRRTMGGAWRQEAIARGFAIAQRFSWRAHVAGMEAAFAMVAQKSHP